MRIFIITLSLAVLLLATVAIFQSTSPPTVQPVSYISGDGVLAERTIFFKPDAAIRSSQIHP